MGEDCRVYATPSLVRDIEHACRDLILARVPEGQDSVGTKVSVSHMAPTPMGMDATITVTVTEVDGRRVVLDVVASDTSEMICKGRHERFIVDIEKTAERLKQKAAQAQGS
jgi:predicted thioesterase